MRAHERPDFAYTVKRTQEITNLDAHRQLADRAIPTKTNQNVIVATWNLTNFQLQQRQNVHLELMADIIRPFDVVAVQEVADNLDDFYALVNSSGGAWDFLYTDVAGNQERLAFLYDLDRVVPTGLAAELQMRGYERAKIIIEDIETEEFPGFNLT